MSHCYLVLCRRAALSSVITRNVVHLVSRSSEANAGVHITPIRTRHSNAYSKATWYLDQIPVPRVINQPFTLIVPLHVVTSHSPPEQGTTRILIQLRERQQQSISTGRFLNNRTFQLCSLNARSLYKK